MKETAFTPEEVGRALVEYAQKYKGLIIKKSTIMWRKNEDFSVILTTNIRRENGRNTRKT